MRQRLFIEFVGTFFLTLVVITTGNALAIGGLLAVLVYSGAKISGAHYNPAVSLAMLILRKIKANEAVLYILIQLLAATIAALLAKSITGQDFTLNYNPNFVWGIHLLFEALGTFLLVHTIIMVAVSNEDNNNQYFGLAIGVALFVAASFAGGVSGGAFNPAVGIGPIIVGINSLDSLEMITAATLYLFGPIIGATIAVIASPGFITRFKIKLLPKPE